MILSITKLLVAFSVAVVAASVPLGQQQEQLNVLGRSMLTTANEMQAMQEVVKEGLNDELVSIFVEVNALVAEIYRQIGEFIKEYNMTDEYCIQVVGYMHWARTLEAMEAVQTCAEKVVDEIDGQRLTEMLEQTRQKGIEVKTVVLRELARNGNMNEVERVVGKDLERVQMEWSVMVAALKAGVNELTKFRQTAVLQTKACTSEAIEKYEFHMGFLRYYMNKNDHCRA